MQIVEGPFNWQRWEVGGAFKFKGKKIIIVGNYMNNQSFVEFLSWWIKRICLSLFIMRDGTLDVHYILKYKGNMSVYPSVITFFYLMSVWSYLLLPYLSTHSLCNFLLLSLAAKEKFKTGQGRGRAGQGVQGSKK
jgi:hypothetical protein